MENIVAIREELSDDFLSLAREQLATVRLWWNNWTTTSWIHNSSSGDMNKNGDDKRRPKELRRSISVTKSSLRSRFRMKPDLGKASRTKLKRSSQRMKTCKDWCTQEIINRRSPNQ